MKDYYSILKRREQARNIFWTVVSTVIIALFAVLFVAIANTQAYQRLIGN